MIDRKNGLTYADSGVNIDAGNRLVDLIRPMVRATARAGADAEIGGFGGLFDLKAAGFKDPVLIAATDGVGTKVKIAIETGMHGGIGIDLVAMSVNDLVVQGAEPLFFLDYFACGKLDPEAAAAIVAGIAEGCRESGCALIGGETAEMPGLYKDGDYDLAGFAVGAAERGTLLPRPDIAVGDAVIGLASSGVHSNGFSLVRKIVEMSGLGFGAPAPFSPVMTLGGALLAPICLPKPMTSIFWIPLPSVPRKSVCGFTRLRTTIASASSAAELSTTSNSSRAVPTFLTSISARIGTPIACAVTPYCASTSICPSGVAPPWLPIAGTMKGRAPASTRTFSAACTISLRLVIPRLPTPSAIVIPGLIFSRIPVRENCSLRRAAISRAFEAG